MSNENAVGLEPTTVLRQRIKSPLPSPLGSRIHIGTPYGTRTRITTLKGSCPNPVRRTVHKLGRPCRSRTHASEVGAQCASVTLTTYEMASPEGFEPPTQHS